MQPKEPSEHLEEESEGAAPACYQLTEAPVDLSISQPLAGIGAWDFLVVCKWWFDPVGSGGDLPPGAARWPRARGAEGRIRHVTTALWLPSCPQLPTGPALGHTQSSGQSWEGAQGLPSPALKSCRIPEVRTCHRQNRAEPLGWAWAA